MKLTICEADIAHGFLFKKDHGQEKAKESNIREVKYEKETNQSQCKAIMGRS